MKDYLVGRVHLERPSADAALRYQAQVFDAIFGPAQPTTGRDRPSHHVPIDLCERPQKDPPADMLALCADILALAADVPEVEAHPHGAACVARAKVVLGG